MVSKTATDWTYMFVKKKYYMINLINLQKLTQISEKSLQTPFMADATFS